MLPSPSDLEPSQRGDEGGELVGGGGAVLPFTGVDGT